MATMAMLWCRGQSVLNERTVLKVLETNFSLKTCADESISRFVICLPMNRHLFRVFASPPLRHRLMSSLSGRVAVVTASTDGIGLAVAERLATEGARVVVSSRKQQNVEKAVELLRLKGLTVEGVVCHVGKREDRKRLLQTAVDAFGGIDVLVSNAAVNPAMGHFLDTTEEQFDKILEINIKSHFLLTQESYPLLKKSGKASIVYMSSIGAYQPLPLIAAYSVSKTALLGLTKAVAIQCAEDNIRANCVCPGVVETKFSETLWSNESALQEIQRIVPLRRVAQPHEIAGLVAFLASDDASYVTGESIVVAGGHFSRL